MTPTFEPQHRIVHVASGRRSCPLSSAYALSFARLEQFESIWVYSEDESGRVGLGEAVALPGYSWETSDDVERTVKELLRDAAGSTRETISERCRALAPAYPFATSAVMTALELPDWLHYADATTRLPLAYPLSATLAATELGMALKAAVGRGYRFLKIKVGKDVEQDIEFANTLVRALYDLPLHVSFDANQGHSLAEARRFAHTLTQWGSSQPLWYEQPCDRRDWDALAALCRESKVPIVLDESIYTETDVARAAGIGAAGVKLKLMKHLGLADTWQLAHHARALGLRVTIGNGVATDIGNAAEYLLLAAGISAAGGDLFEAPAEVNGFAKLKTPLIFANLRVEGGEFICDGGAEKLRAQLSQARTQLLAL